MKLTGDISRITTKRDSKNSGVELQIDKIEYITYLQDGRYFQPFDFEDILPTPLVITGDCLARSTKNFLEEGEYEFDVFDKTGDVYELNPNKYLAVATEYDEESGLTILTSISYSVTITNEEFKQLKKERGQDKLLRKGKDKKNR
jgi:hypothetical protein